MRNVILNKLKEIEELHQIKILFSCESGSRGWQFASPDSDYDVRFIYIRTTNEYLSLAGRPDQLSFPINDELDIYGWDLSKTLKLIFRSNTTPFEWLQSPIVYREEAGFKAELMELCKQYFSQRSNAYHYLGIAKGAMETMNVEGMITIKKLFYVLRPMLAAKWCVDQNTIAPMTIGPLLTLMPEDLRHEVEALIEQKAAAAEEFLVKPGAGLLSWIKETDQLCTEKSGFLPKNHFDVSMLNHFFRKTITQHDHTGT